MSTVQHKIEDMIHFALRCLYFLTDLKLKSFWYRQRQVVLASGDAQTLFVKNLDNDSRIRLLTGGLKILFNINLRQKVEKFVAVAVQKIYRIRRTRIARLGRHKEQYENLNLTCSYPEEAWCAFVS